jgi:hypothetical protein
MATYLLTGSHTAAMAARDAKRAAGHLDVTGAAGLGQYLLDWMKHPDLWAAHAEDLIARWAEDHPGRRPWGWWRYAAPGPRRQLAGSGRPAPEPAWREHGGLPALLDLDPDDPPVFESEPAALRRLDVFTREEARRLTAEAFAPVAMVVLTGEARTCSALGYATVAEAADLDDDPDTEPDDEEA